MDGLHDFMSKWLTEDELVKAMEQHRLYQEGSGVWARPAAAAAASRMPAYGWWLQFGTAAPELQKVAMLALSQPSSACPCETNWSTYQFIHSSERNRLDPTRAESLVFVHSNIRLLRKLQAVDYYEQFPAYPSSDSDADAGSDADDAASGWASEESEQGELGSDEDEDEDGSDEPGNEGASDESSKESEDGE